MAEAPAPRPVEKPVKKDSVPVIISPQDKPAGKEESFNVTLLLALSARQYLYRDSTGNYAIPEMDPLNMSALQFYEGWKKAEGAGNGYIKTTVVDAGIDSLELTRFLKNKELQKTDLIISILNPSMTQAAAALSSENNYPLLITSHPSSSFLSGNKKCWLALPSNKSQCRQMASFVKHDNNGAVFHVIYRESSKNESDLAGLFYGELIAAGLDTAVCHKISYDADAWTGSSGHLVSGKKNVLFLPTSDESFLSSLLTKLDIEEQYEITIAGLPTWENFGSVDPVLLERFDTYIFSSTYLDYQNDEVKNFRKQFIEEKHADPLLAAYQGFDLYNWIYSNRAKANDMEKFESTSSLQSPFTGFEFRRLCDGCGFENQYISVLKYKEEALEKVNR